MSKRPSVERAVREPSAAYFALVMATGILSVAAHLLGFTLFARLLFAGNLAAYGLLWLLTVLRLGCCFRLVVADLTNPAYFVIILLIIYRLLLHPLKPEQFVPPYWINMGAAAITTLAGTSLAGGGGLHLLCRPCRLDGRFPRLAPQSVDGTEMMRHMPRSKVARPKLTSIGHLCPLRAQGFFRYSLRETTNPNRSERRYTSWQGIPWYSGSAPGAGL